ncbi:hypothetical protein CRE_14731 [Caenorhabditis remanei]|uniref:F-box domain-containing protein n=1 Tax=Caenorhabditis remanei TaxID=31234 RepID=E3M9T1_CAERE|nr:hypothetical protein CRE_14731 [Caenorhabditis remanei]
MTCWNYLPAEIKQHVVKKLDFMSRVALRSTCRLNYHIVNSTKLELPRVRFGYKRGRSLIVIYTGIEKFLRLEFGNCEQGPVVMKSENTCDPKETITKLLPSPVNSIVYSILTLISLLAHQSILIKVMEWEVSPEDFERFIGRLILIFLDGRKFRITEIAMRQQKWTQILHKFPFDMLYFDELENIRQMALTIHPQRLTLFMVYQFKQCINGKWLCSIHRTLGTEVKSDDIVSCCHKSECGAFVYTVEKQFEYHLDYLKQFVREDLRGKYDRDEKIQKASKNKKMELSWGFGSDVSIGYDVQPGNNFPTNPILDNFKDLEDVGDPENVTLEYFEDS